MNQIDHFYNKKKIVSIEWIGDKGANGTNAGYTCLLLLTYNEQEESEDE